MSIRVLLQDCCIQVHSASIVKEKSEAEIMWDRLCMDFRLNVRGDNVITFAQRAILWGRS